jgi:hypothetical protein
MIKNIGTQDKYIRLIAAGLIVALYLFKVISGTIGIVGLAIALILIATSLIQFCPLYWPFGITTDSKKQ